MSREKQIEEMARDLCESCDNGICRSRGTPCDLQCACGCLAEEFYEKGYRKQSEVVRCKDCEHFYQVGDVRICRHWNYHSTKDDAYCSFAKMKGGAE